MFIILLVRSRIEWIREIFSLFKENRVYAVPIFKGKRALSDEYRGRVSKEQIRLHVEISTETFFFLI